MSRLAALLIVGFAVTGMVRSASGQESTREDFKEFCDAGIGRWVGDVTWIADWPGLGKKGDKVTCYCEIRPTEDGNALYGKFFGGSGSTTWLTYYDAGSKQIKELAVSSGGTVTTTVFFKKDGKWVGLQKGSLADGSKIKAKNTLTISENGDKNTWTGTTTIEGKETDKLHDVWRRVAK